jgi:hypothetical protein
VVHKVPYRVYKMIMNFFSSCDHVLVELGDKEENHERVVPVKDKRNKITFNLSIKPTSPS